MEDLLLLLHHFVLLYICIEHRHKLEYSIQLWILCISHCCTICIIEHSLYSWLCMYQHHIAYVVELHIQKWCRSEQRNRSVRKRQMNIEWQMKCEKRIEKLACTKKKKKKTKCVRYHRKNKMKRKHADKKLCVCSWGLLLAVAFFFHLRYFITLSEYLWQMLFSIQKKIPSHSRPLNVFSLQFRFSNFLLFFSNNFNGNYR